MGVVCYNSTLGPNLLIRGSISQVAQFLGQGTYDLRITGSSSVKKKIQILRLCPRYLESEYPGMRPPDSQF